MENSLEKWIIDNYPKVNIDDPPVKGEQYTYASFDSGKTFYGPILKKDIETFKRKTDPEYKFGEGPVDYKLEIEMEAPIDTEDE